jgi:hypothetical protein
MIDENNIENLKPDSYDFPLANREFRFGLVNELIELEAFASVYGEYEHCVDGIMNDFKNLHELILIYEQPGYLDLLVSQFQRLANHNLMPKLVECQKFQDSLKENIRNTHEKISELLKFASQLIHTLENGITKLFPNISIKIVGETVKDIKNYLV